MVGVAGAQGAVHAVGGHHQVGVGQPVGRDLAAEGEVDAETAGAVGEQVEQPVASDAVPLVAPVPGGQVPLLVADVGDALPPVQDRKSTRLNSSHVKSSYAVFCLK